MRDRDVFKIIYRLIFLFGFGNLWLDGAIGNDTTIRYKMRQIFLFLLLAQFIILQFMAASIGDFPEDEKSNAATLTLTFFLVMAKLTIFYCQKRLIVKLTSDMIEACEENEDSALIKKKHKIIKINIIIYFVNVYGCCMFFVFEGIRKAKSGVHFVTAVTYYPAYDDNSSLANSFRIFSTGIFLLVVSMVLTVDITTMIHLIFLKYNFITLRHFFENLRELFDSESKTDLQTAAENLTLGVVKGIQMHAKLLRMFNYINSAFGNVVTMQIFMCCGSAASLLSEIAFAENLPTTVYIKAFFFLASIYFLLGLYLCNAGEITYQASLLPDAIFYCGWHAFQPQKCPQRKLRSVVLTSIFQAQRPLTMKGFKMIDLTYATFINVLRTTYSVCALLFTQIK